MCCVLGANGTADLFPCDGDVGRKEGRGAEDASGVEVLSVRGCLRDEVK